MIGFAYWLALLLVAPVADSTGAQRLVTQRGGAGLHWFGPLPGNEGRDVLVYVPPGHDPDAGLQLVVHFHGTYSEHVQQRGEGVPKKKWVGWSRLSQTLDAVDGLQAGGRNIALVYPLSAGKRKPTGHRGWWNHAFDIQWMEHSFDTLLGDTRNVLDRELGVASAVVSVIAEGHSAGGIALYNIAQSAPTAVNEMIFLDASFQGWADGCYHTLRQAGSTTKITIVQTERGIADPHRGRTPWCADTDALDADERWWCDALANDMADVGRVTLHRTKIRHGDQPRHFVGGLELPADRH